MVLMLMMSVLTFLTTDDAIDDDTDDDTDDSGRGSLYTIAYIKTLILDVCTGMNEHPRRAVDVILSQIKAPIELFNSRSVLYSKSWSK